MSTTLKPPLSLVELRTIQSRNLNNEDVRTLLWEIKRMQLILQQVDALVNSSSAKVLSDKPIVQQLRGWMDAEPCVLEHRKWKRDILNPWDSSDEKEE